MPKSYFPNTPSDDYIRQGFELDQRAELAIRLIQQWGMVQGITGQEDSTGRAKTDLMAPADVVQRALAMSDYCFTKLDELGWIRPVTRTLEEAYAEGGRLASIQDSARYQTRDEMAKTIRQAREALSDRG